MERKSRYPGEDLSFSDAERFSLLLCDEEMLETLHEKAEAIRYAYKIGHTAAWEMLQESEQFTAEQLAAINYGMAVQEAASSMLEPEGDGLDMNDIEGKFNVRLQIIRSLQDIGENPFNKIDALDDVMRERNPMRTDLVGELADINFSRRRADDAIAGAALARYIELETAKVG